MKTTRFTLPAAAYVLLFKGDSLLLIERKNGWAEGMYSLPAGHIDGNETVTQAAIRETQEEIGVLLDPEMLEVKLVMHRRSDDCEYFDFFILAKSWGGTPTICEEEKIADLAFYPLDALPEKTLPHVRKAIEAIDKKIFYLESGWD